MNWTTQVDRAVRVWEEHPNMDWHPGVETFGLVEVEVTTEPPPCATVVDPTGDVPLDWWWPGEKSRKSEAT